MKAFSLFVTVLALLTLACSVSSAPANTAAQIAQPSKYTPQEATGSTQRAAFALGRVYVRSCASTGCQTLGFIEAGGQVEPLGEAVNTAHPDCKQWQPVEWRGGIGYVCAAWLAY